MNSPTASSGTTADSTRPSDISAGKRPASSSRPQNLRFQRRTSERAYLEGAYRDGSIASSDLSAQRQSGMDYSAGAAGSSPWASSPEASRQSFGDQVEAGESLPPPAVMQQQREEGGWSAEQQQQWQHQAQAQGQQQYPPQGQQQPQYQGNGEENRRPHSAARYHGAPPHHQPPQQRQPAPQYKLQAKITGLERTGKKDAILRFDVYVRSTPKVNAYDGKLTCYRPIFPSSALLSFATFAALTLSSRSSSLIYRPRIRKH